MTNPPPGGARPLSAESERFLDIGWTVLLLGLAVFCVSRVYDVVIVEVDWHEIARVFVLGLYTALRVFFWIAVASAIWVPVGVIIGLRPKLAQAIQPVVQVLAAFPANLLFPLFVVLITRFQANPEFWLSPLMILGTQWYVLFNVVAGASGVPTELRYAAKNLRLTGWLKWRRYLLPSVFPSFVTGAITASGGSWNAAIVAEYVTWGDTTLVAHGIGSYIAQMTAVGDFPRIALGIGVMCIYVMALNHHVWRRLYRLAEDRMHF